MGKKKATKKIKFNPPTPYEINSWYIYNKNGELQKTWCNSISEKEIIENMLNYFELQEEEKQLYGPNYNNNYKLNNIYSTALIQTGFCTSYKETLNTDFIDIHEGIINFFTNYEEKMNLQNKTPSLTKELATETSNMLQKLNGYKNFITSKNAFFSFLPCFTKGCIRVTHMQHIVWNLLDININEQTYTIELKSYSAETQNNFEKTWWVKNKLKAIISIKTNENDTGFGLKIEYQLPIIDLLDTYQISIGINPNSIFNDTKDKIIWKTNIKKSYAQMNELSNKIQKTQYDIILSEFLTAISFTNMILQNQKRDKTINNPSKNSVTNKITEKDENTAYTKNPERIVHKINLITITSTKKPKCPSKKSIANYRLTSWLTRGHMRHYKSGKTIYIKPSVHNRKKLIDIKKDDNRPKQTIYINK